jgi:hypothetical protein
MATCCIANRDDVTGSTTLTVIKKNGLEVVELVLRWQELLL